MLTGLKKGSLVGITGRIQTRSYDNQQGQRVYVTEVVAENFQMLESRSAREGQSVDLILHQLPVMQHLQIQLPDFSRDENPFGSTNPLDISDDDLPF